MKRLIKTLKAKAVESVVSDDILERPEASGHFNWKLMLKDWKFYANIIFVAILCMCAQASIEPATLTTWNGVIDLIINTFANPYALALVVYNVYNYVQDPTVKGWTHSEKALNYTKK